MYRRQFLQNSLLTLGVISFRKSEILKVIQTAPWKITMLTDDIGIFTEKGGTIAFHYSKEGITVVDAQFPDSAVHLINELKRNKGYPFRLLINTHHHGDHTSGNISFKGVTGQVLAHKNSLANQQRVAQQNNKEDQQYYPNQTFEKEHTEDIGNEKVSLYYYGAGHTNGDALIHFTNANIVHVGDLVFNRRHPFIDRSAGANIKSWITVLNTAVKKFDNKTLYVCGHSGESYNVKGSKDMLVSFRDYLSNLLHFVDGEIKAGESKEEILKNTTIPGSPEWKGEGIERPLTAAYEEIMNT